MANSVTNKEMASMISKYCGISKETILEIRRAEIDITKRLLMSGYEVSFGILGKFTYKEHAPRQPREFKMPQTGEIIMLPFQDAYQTPFFRFAEKYKDEMKEKTLGCLF